MLFQVVKMRNQLAVVHMSRDTMEQKNLDLLFNTSIKSRNYMRQRTKEDQMIDCLKKQRLRKLGLGLEKYNETKRIKR